MTRSRAGALRSATRIDTAEEEAPHARFRAWKDPQRRSRRTPWHGQDLARRGAAVPGRRDEPARHDRSGLDGRGLGRRRAAAADVDLALADARGVAGAEDQPDRRSGRPELPGRGALLAARRRRSALRPQRRDGRRGRHDPRLEARRGARPRARPLRQHARPRARRLLPRARRSSRSSSRRAAWPFTSRSAPSTS